MNLKFIVNDYVLIWNLLFQASISKEVQDIKQKIWQNYQNEYNKTFEDLPLILKDSKNFIPSNDTIYNIVLETKEYEQIKKETEKFRIALLKIWDENKKKAIVYLKDIIRIDIKEYNILVVSEKLNIVDTTHIKDANTNSIIWGREINTTNSFITFLQLIYEIVKIEFKNYQADYKDIVNAILELAILNEFPTRMTNISYYFLGDNSLKILKRKIYPYFLMYLGINLDKMKEMMIRDKIDFNLANYPYEKQLQKFNLYEFIDFCIRNQKYIFKGEDMEIEVI